LLTFCVAGVENADVGIALDGQFPWSAWWCKGVFE
jgi:hypothetical protein